MVDPLREEMLTKLRRMSLCELLQLWRFEPVGSPWFQGEVGREASARLTALREADPDDYTRCSKLIGWGRG